MRSSRGELKSVSSLFDVYKKRLRAPESTVVKEFVDVVNDLLSVSISPEKVTYDPLGRVVVFRGVGMFRNELKMREEEILTHLKARLGEKSCPKRLV